MNACPAHLRRHAEEDEFKSAIDMFHRATVTLVENMLGIASVMELKSASSFAQALGVIMAKVSAISTSDASKVTALGQTQSDDSKIGGS